MRGRAGCLLALGAVAVAFVVRLLVDPVRRARLPYAVFYVAIAASARFGGLGPALVALVLGGAAGLWFFTPPRFSFGLASFDAVIAPIAYALAGAGGRGVGLDGVPPSRRRGRVRRRVEGVGRRGDAVRARVPAAPRRRPLVSDIAMPGEDGCALVRALRRTGRGRLPALAITGLASESDRTRALAAGFDEHMAKPVDGDALVERIDALVGRVARPPA